MAKNYYENKKDLVTKYEKMGIRSVSADYSHENNIITIYGNHNDSTPHELFHMSFRDREKVGKEITEGVIYGNGVCFKDTENDRKHLEGTVEGIAEYLTKKCTSTINGHSVEYFFIDLLIGIYGEEILEYAFLNDPFGFIMDNRFYNIINFTKSLDAYNFSAQEIQITSYLKKDIEEAIQNDEVTRKELCKCLDATINRLRESLPRLFDAIIEEYLSYNKCQMEKDLFVAKLSSFIPNQDHAPLFVFDEDYLVRKKIRDSIDKIK